MLLKRLKVTQSKVAKAFLQQWPEARKALDTVAQSDLLISGSFSEAATQSAFITLANRHRHSESTIQAVLSHCDKLLRRTDPLSPSKFPSKLPPSLSSDSESFTVAPGDAFHNTQRQCPSLQTSSATILPSTADLDTAPQTVTTSTPSSHVAVPMTVTAERADPSSELPRMQELQTENSTGAGGIAPAPATLLPPMATSLAPMQVTHLGRSFHILPLSSTTPVSFRSGRDLIIPPPEAFSNPITASAPQFPPFSARTSNWTSIFEMVKQPCFLWNCWRPGNLGEYGSIKELWTAWHEGTAVEGVGQLPALQLVEQEWGGTKDKSTNKGRRQAWRPHNNNNVSVVRSHPCRWSILFSHAALCGQVRRQWSQFMFFVNRVNSMMDAGKHASEAVRALDEDRGSMSLPQFHSTLQAKKTRS